MPPADAPEINLLLPLIDRMIQPLVRGMEQLDARQREDTISLHAKLDKVTNMDHAIGIATAESQANSLAVIALKLRTDELSLQAATTRGQNKVILWLMATVGAPIVVALSLAGITKLFGFHI